MGVGWYLRIEKDKVAQKSFQATWNIEQTKINNCFNYLLVFLLAIYPFSCIEYYNISFKQFSRIFSLCLFLSLEPRTYDLFYYTSRGILGGVQYLTNKYRIWKISAALYTQLIKLRSMSNFCLTYFKFILS